MSSEPVEVVKATYEAFAAGDMPKVIDLISEVDWVESEGMPYGGRYKGAQAVVDNVLVPISQDVKGFSARPEAILPVGDNQALGLGHYRGEGHAETVDVPFAHLWSVENGRIKRFVQYADTAKFRRAVGK